MADEILDIADEIVKAFEGLRLDAYHDRLGFPTIGYGHLLSRERWGSLDRYAPLADEAAAVALLWDDMRAAYASVLRLIRTEILSDAQIAALVDFAFNCGAGNLQVSTLRRVINRGELRAAPAQFSRWIWAGGIKLPGLVRRRAAEAALWGAVH